MLEIPLSAIPNQSFSIRLGQHQWDFAIHAANNIMAVDLVKDGTVILTGERVVAGFPIIPYRYLESGNFIFSTMNNEYPDYTQFGTTQSLLYATELELGTIRAGT